MRARRWRTGLRYVLLTLLAAVVLFPLYLAVVGSLLRPVDIASQPPRLFPAHPHWSAYSRAWQGGHLARYLSNSAIVTGIIVAGQVVTATLAAYAFAFLRFPLKRTLFVVLVATLTVPFEATIVTNLRTIQDLGWYDSYAGLAVPFLATGFGVLLIRHAFLRIPRDLQDAAALDGYGHWRFMTTVAVPLARPAVGALGVLAFVSAWSQYLWPLIVTKSDRMRTVQVGLQHLRATHLDRLDITLAGAIIAVVPMVIVVALFGARLVRGFTAATGRDRRAPAEAPSG